MSRKTPVHLIAGARPNFMKIAPIFHEMQRSAVFEPRIVHTGQHYDAAMSDAFFKALRLPEPAHYLGVGSGSHGEQTAKIMLAYEPVCREDSPAIVVVVGDVNSTVACTLIAVKLGIPVAHVEAGLRSFDRTMPEEINRLVTDSICDMHLIPSPDADENLRREGIAPEKIRFVGNVMIDSLEMLRGEIMQNGYREKLKLAEKSYGIVTLHRPSNVDSAETLPKLVELLVGLGKSTPLIFPVHPRTRKRLEDLKLLGHFEKNSGVILSEPLGYLEFMNLLFSAKIVVTDSGGIQEETTYLGIPCVTLRENTERPITVTQGTNRLTSLNTAAKDFADALTARKAQRVPDLWDGKTAPRIVQELETLFRSRKEVPISRS